MDAHFDFLGDSRADLMREVLARRNPALFERLRGTTSLSRSDADDVMSVLSEELTNSLDDDWEPTDYGRTVSAVLAQFNTARVAEWP